MAPDRESRFERTRSRGDLAVVEFESVSPRRDHDVDGVENLKPSKGMAFGTAVRAGLGN